MKKQVLVLAMSAILLAACGKKEEPVAAPAAPAPVAAAPAAPAGPVLDDEKVVNVYNWPDYITESLIADFEKEYGVKVNYDTFENNEALHAKLVAGNSGYDIVVPTADFGKRQIEGGLYQPIDKSKLKNYGNLDPDFMSKIAGVDPENKYLVPWAWGFTTVGINKQKVEKALGGMPMPENAWDLVFKPEYSSKLKSCGIAYLDSPSEILPVALHYVGKPAYSENPEDFKLAGEMLKKVRKDVRLFSSTMIDDIAGGKACAFIGWSGDINIAAGRVKETGGKDEIVPLLPTGGGRVFIDTIAHPQGRQAREQRARLHRLLPARDQRRGHGQRDELPHRQQGRAGRHQGRGEEQQHHLPGSGRHGAPDPHRWLLQRLPGRGQRNLQRLQTRQVSTTVPLLR
ncbi:extracellular solute-binding protein [Hydrogenophaga sp. UC242_50]|uniref:extracellular solute-binding protein n=1 Tax=Hydrogenophaga sp. UC242_50 TaxID=3350169 RepID=UPI0036D357C3